MAEWTRADIKSKIRLVTGRPNTTMLSDADLETRINRYYQFVLPKELKIFWGYTNYSFYTQPNVDQYASPFTTFQTFNPDVRVDGFSVNWYIDPDLFYQSYPLQLNKTVVGQGDGSTAAFAFTIPAVPVLANSVYVTDGTQVVYDNGSGVFVGDGTGSIDYSTGVCSVTFSAIPASGLNIVQSSYTYMAARPQAMLYYKSSSLTDSLPATRNAQNYFVLRPVPDQVYKVTLRGIQVPAELANDTDVPYRSDLGPLIAYGVSLDIFSDYNQMDQYRETLVEYERYKSNSMQDTIEEYLYQRSIPKF